MEKIKVIYIMGWGRSGTTLLANILGQIPDWFSAGELRAIWGFSLQENAQCGCKSLFRECKVWKEIFTTAFGGFDNINRLKMQKITHNETRSLRLPWFFMSKGKCRNFQHRKDYLATLESLYSSIANSTKCNAIIDSSKAPVYAGVLRLIPSIDLYVVHVVRDPRAVAFSWLTPKENNEFNEVWYRNPFDNALNWNAGNLAAEYLGLLQKDKYIRIKYEDFIVEPDRHVTKIMEMLGQTAHELLIEQDKKVHLKPTHTAWGNPGRFNTGLVELKTDIRWKLNLSTLNKLLTTLLTFLLMIRYGYQIDE